MFWVIAILLLAWQSIGFLVAYRFLYKDYHSPLPFESPDAHGISFREVKIPVEVAKGQTIFLSGWFLPADETGVDFQQGAVVLMLHGFGSAKGKVWTDPENGYAASLMDQGAESLVRGGFHVLMLDFRNFGGSEDYGQITLGLKETEDVVAAVHFIVNELPRTEPHIDPTRVGIRAPSMGAATTILALADREGSPLPVQAIWLDSGFATADGAVTDFLSHHGFSGVFLPPIKFWLQRLSGARLADVQPVRKIESLGCNVMLVHSEDDTMIRVDHFFQLQQATASMPNVECWLVDTHQHHRLWLNPEYHRRQLEFFRRHLAPRPEGG